MCCFFLFGPNLLLFLLVKTVSGIGGFVPAASFCRKKSTEADARLLCLVVPKGIEPLS